MLKTLRTRKLACLQNVPSLTQGYHAPPHKPEPYHHLLLVPFVCISSPRRLTRAQHCSSWLVRVPLNECTQRITGSKRAPSAIPYMCERKWHWGRGCSSVAKHTICMRKVLSSISSCLSCYSRETKRSICKPWRATGCAELDGSMDWWGLFSILYTIGFTPR